jgi:hypothetical protein
LEELLQGDQDRDLVGENLHEDGKLERLDSIEWSRNKLGSLQ